MKKKIIRASTIPTSLNTFCKGILHKLSKEYEVIALSSPGTELKEISTRERVRVMEVQMKRQISLFADFFSLIRLIIIFGHEKPTMVHSITPKAGLLCMMAAWLTRVPVRVHTFTGLVFPTSIGLRRRVLMLTDAITCFCATHINPEGIGVRDDLLNYGISKKPMRILGYGNVRGVDMEYYNRRPEIMKAARIIQDERRFTFLYVGRIVKDKGINELCEAFHRLSSTLSVRLLIVGDYEDALDPISEVSKSIIRENKNVEWVGKRFGDDLLAHYAAADCFVLPSYREGFPNTVLEAGAMGLPCIVTDVNGSREIISEEINGLIVPPRDADTLYHTMMRLIDDSVLRKQMASRAREMIAQRYEQGFVHNCLLDFYKEIL